MSQKQPLPLPELYKNVLIQRHVIQDYKLCKSVQWWEQLEESFGDTCRNSRNSIEGTETRHQQLHNNVCAERERESIWTVRNTDIPLKTLLECPVHLKAFEDKHTALCSHIIQLGRTTIHQHLALHWIWSTWSVPTGAFLVRANINR